MKSTMNANSQRLESLDILRGLDLFLLVMFQPVAVALLTKLDIPQLSGILHQLDHEVWEGFRFWDLIMPLFLFMSGVSMPFSFSRYKLCKEKAPIYYKILRRFIILFILGMVVQGNLLGLNIKYIYIYTNTLQAIATGYLISSVIYLNLSFRNQILAGICLLFAYWIPMTMFGDFTPEGNFAEKVDRLVLGRFRDGVFWDDKGAWNFSPYYSYTWILSSLTFGASVLMGTIAGEIIRRKQRVTSVLCITGVVLIALSLLWSFQMPIIKRIWTSSMALFAGGICFTLMGLFYYTIDVKGHSSKLKWLKIYGMNSIVAYVLGECINFRSAVHSVSYGLEQYLGDYYQVWLTFGNFMIIFIILRFMYSKKIFVKI